MASVLLVGWDGAQANDVRALLDAGELPNLAEIVRQGGYANVMVDEGRTETKPGWSQILTGYNTTEIGVISNENYRPIPRGLTLFERLREKYGGQISMLFASGKDNNLGARGPHLLCTNCNHRYENRSKTDWWAENTTAPFEGRERTFELRQGEPYHNAVAALDEYESGLEGGKNVAAEAVRWLENGTGPFFAFVHFEEPDEQGHLYGEGSVEYLDAIRAADSWLGRLVAEARKRDARAEIIVTSDHGFDLGKTTHKDAPHTFLAASVKVAPEATRRDVAPLVLSAFGMQNAGPVRIGYFHGGRTALFYRAYTNGYFENAKVNVTLVTKSLRGESFSEVPMDYSDVQDKPGFGKVTGTDLLVGGLIAGDFDAATVGESAFIMAAGAGAPIVAVASLGHDTVENPGHAIIFRTGVQVNSSSGIRGKTLATRRSSGGDLMFLDEFLQAEGLDPEKDVKIIDNVDDDILTQMMENKSIDGGYFHLRSLRSLVESGNAYVYRKMDWVNPELSQALLVFRKDFVQAHQGEVQSIVTEYSRRIRYEAGLTLQERMRRPGAGEDSALEMATDFQGMNLPQCDYPPLVNSTLLYQFRDLLFKHNMTDSKTELGGYVDNSFVQKAYEQLQAK
jgi:ABC-type nitrate/sulfonate/bicarbonate transport system substrate-binding protein